MTAPDIQPVPPSSEPAEPPGPPLGRIVLGVLLVLGGIFWFADALDWWDVPWLAMFPATLIVIGAALVAGARYGAHSGGLVGLGIVLTAVVIVTSLAGSVFDVSFEGGIGERSERPATIESPYRHAIGQYVVDLREANVPSGTSLVEVTLGIGDLRVYVPAGVTVEVTAGAGVGDVQVAGRQSSGFDPDVEATLGSGDRTIRLEARVGVGKVEVFR